MRKSWPLALAVIAVGGFAGAAIAGRPETPDPFVLESSATDAVDDTAVAIPTLAPATTAPVATTISVATTVAPATTTTVAPTTATPTTTAVETTAAATTTTVAGPLPRNQVRLEIANGDGRFRLATVTGDRMAPLGYVIDLGDALVPVDATILYFRPGFDDEARIVAADIGVPDATIAPYPPGTSITGSDDRGDIIVVLGPDAPR